MTKIVGILNVTPDSFSDAGINLDPKDALSGIEQQIKDGVDVIDIGAESTRPGATVLTARQEWARLKPVLSSLAPLLPQMTFSLDTRHAPNAKKALKFGIGWLNDVSGFSFSGMIDAAKRSDCKLVMMHSLTVPVNQTIVMKEPDVVRAILEWARERIAKLEDEGIARERIIFDPGIGFGKTKEQSWQIIHEVKRFGELGVPILIGHSRKLFLAEAGASRDEATLKMSEYLIGQGVDYLRVHDVAAHKKLLEKHG